MLPVTVLPLTWMVTGWRFGNQRRSARLRFMPTDCGFQPVIGRLPQTSQTLAMGISTREKPARRRRNGADPTGYDPAMQRDSGVGLPRVILVSGAPGSGKTTLATSLAAELHLPLISRDAIKEALCDVLGAPTVERSQAIGAASYRVLYEVLDRLVGARVDAVVESNFRRRRSEDELGRFRGRSEMRIVHCTAPRAVVLERYARRTAGGDRHAGHHDAARLEPLGDDLSAGRFAPIELDVPTLTVDTTSGYRPSFAEIVEFAGGRVAAPSTA